MENDGKHIFTYKDKTGLEKQFEISGTHFNIHEQMERDYEKSRDYILSHFIHIWNQSIKSYLLYTGDRQIEIQSWQTNVALGLIRSMIDVYVSFLENTPLNFVVNGISSEAYDMPRGDDKLGRTRVDFAKNFVNYVGQTTSFGDEASLGLIDGVQIGMAIFRTLYKNTMDKKEQQLLCKIGDDFQMITYQNNQVNTPYTVSVDPYHVFPDPYCGKNPRYVVERTVMSQKDFFDTYQTLLFSEDNKLKYADATFLAEIISNRNEGTSFEDFSNIRDQIYSYENNKLSFADTIYKQKRNIVSTSTKTEIEEQKDLVEVKYAEYPDRIVISANKYPVFIGENKYGAIQYDFAQAFNSRSLFSEGPAYLQFGLEMAENSFYNNFIDNARVAAHTRWIGDEDVFPDKGRIMDLPPGGIFWGHGTSKEEVLRPLIAQPATDNGVMNLSQLYSQRLSGISEIDQGIASKLRVASEGAALSTATNRRMNGYVRRYLTTIGKVGVRWIDLFKRFNLVSEDKTWGFVKDVDGVVKTFDVTTNDLSGSYFVTLDSQGLFAMSGESAVARKLDVFARFEKLLTPEQTKRLMQSIYRDMQLNPAFYLPDSEPIPPKPLNPEDNMLSDMMGEKTPVEMQGQEMAKAMNMQGDMGHGGDGQPK